jgi:hypothetical protein
LLLNEKKSYLAFAEEIDDDKNTAKSSIIIILLFTTTVFILNCLGITYGYIFITIIKND